MKTRFTSFLLALLCSGCVTTHGPEQSGAPVEDGVTTITAGSFDGGNLPHELKDHRNILSQRGVYFDYDSFEVKKEYQPIVFAHAKFLVANRHLRILIQGNTDERGSREYNLALGQKRADAIRRLLATLGVRDDQMEAVSLGEEKPRNEARDELAWAENRRGDILYHGEF